MKTKAWLNSPKVVVVGSINCDLTTYVMRFPRENETLMGGRSSLAVGGKGLNQAVAALQAGGTVEMVAAVGDDSFGLAAKNYLQQKGVGIGHVHTINAATTGTASILVDANAHNMIAVAAGANAYLLPSAVYAAEALIAAADLLIVQQEVPLETVGAALQIAKHYGLMTLVNPAPAMLGINDLIAGVTLITPNESELASLTGVDAFHGNGIGDGLAQLRSRGAAIALVTRAERGCRFLMAEGEASVPAFNVKAVDTTGAGDVFNGFLGVSLVGLPRFLSSVPGTKREWNFTMAEVEWAVRRASAAAALSVMRPSAQDAAPTMAEVEQFLTA